MNLLKQSTAATIKLGPFIDDTDGKTAETGLTISQADIRLSKNGGDIAQTHDATGATHDELGYYNVPLDATDTNTLGRLLVAVHESGALPVWQEFLVVTANVYDTLCSTDTFDVNVTALADDVITAGKFDESTAYPLKSADTGNTQVARVGADSDTLETLSDQIDAVKAETALIVADTGTDGVVVASGQTVATVTNLTNLPTMPADWVTASGLKADAVTEIQSGLALEATLTAIKGAGWTTETLVTLKAYVDEIETRLTATRAGYLDKLNVTGTLAHSDAAATYKADVSGLAPANEYDARMTALQADLDNPDQYKADVSELATQESVNAIPTTPLLAANYTAPDNAGIGAIKTKTDQLTFTTLNKVDASATIDPTGLATSADLAVVDGNVDAIKEKTDQMVFTVANKIDASATVDPTGIATSEELEIIGEKVDDVLDKLNVSSVEFVTAVVGSTITILRGDTLTASLLNLGSMESYVSLDFTVKASTHQSDDAALIRVRKNASGLTDGLLRLNGAAHTTGTDGSITINDAPTGDVTIMLKAGVTDDLVPGTYVYDIQLIEAAEVTTLTTGSLIVSADVTRLVA